MTDGFIRFSRWAAAAFGSPWAFVGALSVVVAWAVLGPVFGFSQAWQLVINTGTTIVTFLMVFLIQSTQNRDGAAVHLKLDELLRAVREARTGLVDLEELPEEDIRRLQDEFRGLSRTNVAALEAELRAEAAASKRRATEAGARTSAPPLRGRTIRRRRRAGGDGGGRRTGDDGSR